MATTIEAAAFFRAGEKCRPGGCALRGARIALQPITNAVHVLHGTASCLGHVWASRPTASSGSHLHRHTVSTALGETELILGGSDNLQNLLSRVVRELAPAVIFVYQSCITAMVGDDLRTECSIAARRLGLPVLAVEASGLAGGKQMGNRLAARLLCEQVIGTLEPAFCSNADINLIGEFNVHGEVAELRALLRSFGIRILASIPGDARYQEIATAHRARVSLDLCSQSMPRLAEYLQEQYGIPIVRGSIYGGRAFAETLRQLVKVLMARGADEEIEQRFNAWHERQSKHFENTLKQYRKRLEGKRVLIDAGGVKSWALLEDLQAAGLVLRGVSLRKCSLQDKKHHEALRGICQRAGLRQWQQEHVEGLLKAGGIDVLIASDRLKHRALKHGIPHVEISHERTFSLLGYDGMLRLLEEIDLLVHSPVPPQITARIATAEAIASATVLPPAPGRINPFALTQSAGAVLALQGIRGSVPLLFSAQGCAESGATFLSRYFGEQIHLHTVSMSNSDTVGGGHQALRRALDELAVQHPALIAVIATSMMDVQGASHLSVPPALQNKTIFLHAPDFEGSLESGWSKAVHALVRHGLKARPQKSCRTLLVLPGVHQSIGDLEWIKDVVQSFGMDLLVLPDISTALDGSAGEDAVLSNGTTLDELEKIGGGIGYLALGNRMRETAKELDNAGLRGKTFARWSGLHATDSLLDYLADISRAAVPPKYAAQRRQLLDAMMRYMPQLCRIRATAAAESDLLTDLTHWLRELGVRQLHAFAPASASSLRSLPVQSVQVGDYQMLEAHLEKNTLLLAPYSARNLAHAAQVALYPVGIHESHHAGQQFRLRMGYQGARDQIHALINCIEDCHYTN